MTDGVDRDVRLVRLREALDAVEPVTPTDLVDEWDAWRPPPELRHVERHEGVMVSVERIVGTDPMNTDRLVERRLVRIVNRLASGEYESQYDTVHLVQRPNGDYYVSSDGNHRVLAHKYFGYDVIYADVDVYDRGE